MPIYSFEGRRERTGEVVSGVREAASHSMLGQELLLEGILLTHFEGKKQALPGVSLYTALFRRVPILERMLFARYFALMLRAGLDVKRSLTTLQEQTKNKPLKEAIEVVRRGIEKGQTLADSMAAFPNAFPPLFISFVRVGESTGRLQESLEIVAKQLQKDYDLRKAVRGAMMYPAVILIALIAVGIAMMIFVVPKLAEVFEGFDVELPLPTRILIGLSNFIQHFWYVVVLGVLGLSFSVWTLLKNASVREVVFHVLLYTPVVGSIMQKVNLAWFSRNISSLLTSGISFINALEVLGQNAAHPSYANVYRASQDHVKQGKPLSEFLEGFRRLFPPLVVNIMKIGEETGELSSVMNEVALFYEQEVDQTMKNLTSILEPVLMVLIGLAVGGLAVSVISPIYGLVNVL